MSKLAIYIDAVELYARNATLDVPYPSDQSPHLTSRMGENVLIANVDQSGTAQYVALGRLVGFRTDESGLGFVQLDQINSLPKPALTFNLSQTNEIIELSDDDFKDIIRETSDMFDEASALFHRAAGSGLLMDQLGRQTDYRCAFSGVYTGNAVATIIRPIEDGGRVHISNFLYLDREVSDPFSNFHWTVGAEMEVITNTHLMTPELLEIIIPGGQLAVSRNGLESPDPDALAWHRSQFFARINGSQLI